MEQFEKLVCYNANVIYTSSVIDQGTIETNANIVCFGSACKSGSSILLAEYDSGRNG